MTWEQAAIFVILAGSLVMFAWGPLRYDLVALLALLAVTLTGLIDVDQAFVGFGHPAVVTVVAVLVVGKGLEQSGLVEAVSRRLLALGDRTHLQFVALVTMVLITSAFVNNVGALALFLPVALRLSRETGQPPSRSLIPLAFASLLGGLTTLIGTPPNIIISSIRARAVGEPFRMFDFLPTGGTVALVGLVAVVLLAGRLVPVRRSTTDPGSLFEVTKYLTELRVPAGSSAAGQALGAILTDADLVAVGLVRAGEVVTGMSMALVMAVDDVLVVEGDPRAIERVIERHGFVLGGSGNTTGSVLGRFKLFEAVVPPGSFIVGRTATGLRLRGRYGLNLLGVARAGGHIHERLAVVRIEPGDVLLLQGPEEAVRAAIGDLGLLPLAERELSFGRPRNLALGAGIFLASVTATALGLLPVDVAFVAAAVAMVLTRLLTIDAAYRAVDLPIVVLLGAMLPVGEALETTGGADLIAAQVVRFGAISPVAVVAALLVLVMLLSNVVNNAAAAVIAAPIGLHIASALEVSPDPLLMAVAIGASLPLLTPIGHQSNILVMAPGGYRFGDYWRLGLPVSLLTVAVGTAVIVSVWPL